MERKNSLHQRSQQNQKNVLRGTRTSEFMTADIVANHITIGEAGRTSVFFSSLMAKKHESASLDSESGRGMKTFFCLTQCLRPYHVDSTSSRLITEVKQRRARLVLGWVT